MENSKDSNSSRQDFFPQLFGEKMDDLEPAVVLCGDTTDQFPSGEGKYVDLGKKLRTDIGPEIEKGNFDMVIEYNTARHTPSFWDEQKYEDTAEHTMRTDLQKLDIKVTGGDGKNLVPQLFGDSSIREASMDKVFLYTMEKLIEKGDKKVCIIVDKANFLIPAEKKNIVTPSGASEQMKNETVILDLVQLLREYEGNRLILIDQRDELNGALRKSIPFIEIPATTRKDIEDLLKNVVDLDTHSEVLDFAEGVSIRGIQGVLKKVTQEHPENISEKVTDLFRKQKIAEMNRALEGTAESKFTNYTRDQIAMPEAIMEEVDSIIASVKKKSKFLHQGIILPGPPGTGKTALAEYMASACGYPFFKLANIGSESLRGNTEKKLRKLKSVLTKNKPCFLFVDEISDIWGKSTGGMNSTGDKDDAEVSRLLKEMIGSPEMQGVFIIGAANDLDKVDPALYRSERIDEILPILPPVAMEDRKKAFRAVWNQVMEEPAEETVIDYVCTFGEFVEVTDPMTGKAYGTYSEGTGADYKTIIKRAGRMRERNNKTMAENIYTVLETFKWKKDKTFYERIISSIKMGNREDLIQTNDGEVQENPEIERAKVLAKMQASAENREREVSNLEQKKDKLRATMQEIEAQVARYQAELEEIQETLADRVKEATTEERKKMAGRLQEIRARMKDLRRKEGVLTEQEGANVEERQELEERTSDLDKREQRVEEWQVQLTEQAQKMERDLATKIEKDGETKRMTPAEYIEKANNQLSVPMERLLSGEVLEYTDPYLGIQRFHTSSEKCIRFGYFAGDRVLTEDGWGTVIGVRENEGEEKERLWFHIDGEGLRTWNYSKEQFAENFFPALYSPAQYKNCPFSLEELLSDRVMSCYGSLGGVPSSPFKFNASYEACKPFGFFAGDIVKTFKGHIVVVVGTNEKGNALFVHIENRFATLRDETEKDSIYSPARAIFQEIENEKKALLETSGEGDEGGHYQSAQPFDINAVKRVPDWFSAIYDSGRERSWISRFLPDDPIIKGSAILLTAVLIASQISKVFQSQEYIPDEMYPEISRKTVSRVPFYGKESIKINFSDFLLHKNYSNEYLSAYFNRIVLSRDCFETDIVNNEIAFDYCSDEDVQKLVKGYEILRQVTLHTSP